MGRGKQKAVREILERETGREGGEGRKRQSERYWSHRRGEKGEREAEGSQRDIGARDGERRERARRKGRETEEGGRDIVRERRKEGESVRQTDE